METKAPLTYWERFEARKRAATVARDLLLKNLSPAQRDSYTKDREIYVTGSRGGKYRVTVHGVYGEDNHYCIAPRRADCIPDADHILAIKRFLEADEPLFLWIANTGRKSSTFTRRGDWQTHFREYMD